MQVTSKLSLFRLPTLVTCVALAGIAFAAISPANAQEKNVLESVTANTQTVGKVVIRATFKSPLTAVPNGFTVSNPARIAIDLPNTTNGTEKSVVDIGQGDIKTINIVESGTRTRLVMNLARALTYTSTIEERTLVLSVDGTSAGIMRETAQITKFAEPPLQSATAAQRQAVRDVDFRRGPNGEGRVVVDLSSATSGIDIRQQGKVVIIDFINTAVPKNLQRRLDVLDFGTPIRFVDVLDQGANGRMIIEPRGLWEYSAYQTDTQFIVEVKQIKEDPNKLTQGLGYNGEKLSLNFQNIEVRAVLQVIADFTGLNIITRDTVGGSLTLRLKDVPWDQALDIILQSKGLSKRKNGNVVLIAPADELATQEKLALEVAQQTTELEPLRTETHLLSYAKAADVRTILSDGQQKILSKRGSITVDVRTNTIFVQDVPARLDDVRRLIAQLDIPLRQVQIEARIVIADDRFGRDLGVRFGVAAGLTANNRNVGVSNSIGNASQIAGGGSPIAVAGSSGVNVDLPAAGAAALGLTFLNLGNGNLVNLELTALEADRRGKVVSNPRILTVDKRKAIILQGTEIPYPTQSTSGGVTIAFKQAVLSLEVTPQITPDDKILLDITVKKDAVGERIQFSGGTIPTIDKKELSTLILVENGDTAVLGGVYEQVTRTDVRKIPLLGDVPFVGNLFKSTIKQDDKTELLIFITPRIIKDQLNVR